jgi:hypothetical protein
MASVCMETQLEKLNRLENQPADKNSMNGW